VLRPSGAFGSLDAIRDMSFRAGGRVLRLGDIATVSRGYVDPPQQRMRVQGREALGLGITMAAGGDVVKLGQGLDAEMARLKARLPVGVEIVQVASMPVAVQRSVTRSCARSPRPCSSCSRSRS
jgi:multidrug efflux pump